MVDDSTQTTVATASEVLFLVVGCSRSWWCSLECEVLEIANMGKFSRYRRVPEWYSLFDSTGRGFPISRARWDICELTSFNVPQVNGHCREAARVMPLTSNSLSPSLWVLVIPSILLLVMFKGAVYTRYSRFWRAFKEPRVKFSPSAVLRS